MTTFTATYSPDDNKLRLYASSKLDRELYDRVRAAGFIWAPKQELSVAPMWTPEREDLCLELAGEIDDEDKSLVDRAAERSERFKDYSERREAESESAHAAVDHIAQRFEFGQPILVGHHSERRARKDAEKIENGMRRAIKLWETSKYWTSRAAGARAHAKYKEFPAVRARRIKTIEADKRKAERSLEGSRLALKLWAREPMTTELATRITSDGRTGIYRKFPLADYPRLPPASQYEGEMSLNSALDGGIITGEQARDIAVRANTLGAERAQRWVSHCENRLAYERAMLAEDGGLKGASFDYQIGGQIQRRGKWFYIAKVNRRDGAVSSVSVVGHFASTVSLDEITDYRPPTEGTAEKIGKILDKGPMCNYPGEGFKHMTTDEWKRKKMSDVPQALVVKATETTAKHRTRATWGGNWSTVSVFLTDAKRVDAPALAPAADPIELPALPLPPPPGPRADTAPARAAAADKAAPFEAMKQALKTGIKVVSAPQLFPTPRELAERIARAADIRPAHHVLEPSAGTGAIWRELSGKRTAVEINPQLADGLRGMCTGLHDWVICADFLDYQPVERFDRIVMNPPFAGGADIEHIRHALTMLNPGGRLVALCADGPRQRERLKLGVEEMGGTWEALPSGSFKEQGTNVNVAMIVVDAPTCGAGESAGAHLPTCRACRSFFLMSQGRVVAPMAVSA